MTPSEAPLIAIVLPLFRHSVLVVDALESILRQQSRYPFVVIVVNDGCPFRESGLHLKSIQSIHADRLRYIVQKNCGLSAARNTGIEYALREIPSVQAIYFMDADNLILSRAIEAAYGELLEDPQVSWVYPNIDMFGMKKNFDYSGPYSIFKHTQDNICEAGSLVHRRVFDAGIRFDETMKLGYEDWDFWLAAASRGFRGKHLPHFGFRYRNRAESMLSHARQDDAEIRSYMRRKHPRLLNTRSLLRLESEEAHRYAIVLSGSDEALLSSGSSELSERLSSAELDERFWRNVIAPTRQYIPPFFVFTSQSVLECLEELGLLVWVLHSLELSLKETNIACLSIQPRPGTIYDVRGEGRVFQCNAIGISRGLLQTIVRDADTKWIEQIVSPDPGMQVSVQTVTVPQVEGAAPMASPPAVLGLLETIQSWRSSPYARGADRSWIWRETTVPPMHSLYFNIRQALGGEVAYPSPFPESKNIGFVLPIASFGGVERVAYNLALQFANSGWRTHLFVVGKPHIELPKSFVGKFATVNLLAEAAVGLWVPEIQYQGTALSAAQGHPHSTNRIVAAMSWLDAIVNCHSGEFNEAAAKLRRLGVITASHLHLLDQSSAGRSQGHPMIALAYEHAYDLVLCNSRQLMEWMNAAGVPCEKLVYVRNAPGHEVHPERRMHILAGRNDPSRRRLNVLYLGRLDRQKSMDRLTELVNQAQNLNLPIDWRIVGSSVTDGAPVPRLLRAWLEPAVFSDDDLTSLFAWADVMVLLSEFEGVPLSVLEAQRLGVAVIATNVGALAEIVSHGRTGFLTEPGSAVEQTLGYLQLLFELPALRAKIAMASSQVPEWADTAETVIARMNELAAGESRDGITPLRGDPGRK